jgi:photosystem II stability/assembly factor-like uncharacterized protein
LSGSVPQSRRIPPKPVPLSRLRGLGGAFVAAAVLLLAQAAGAASVGAKANGLGSFWTPQGPAPSVDDLFHVPPDGSVDGAVQAVVPHPFIADTIYIGAVNGGVWVTHNARADHPIWHQLTDGETSQAIGALELDPTDVSHQTLVAGPGVYSAYGDGGDLAGLLRTTNGGATWQRLTGGGVMLAKSISGIAARGPVLVASVDFATPFDFPYVGIFRSADSGATFSQMSLGDGTATGLPGGLCHDLAGDPLRPARLFTSVVFADEVGGSNGIYRSDDTGATWTKVSTPAVDAYFVSGHTNNVEFAVGRHNNVYVAIVNDFVLAAVFRSGDGGATWTQMDMPQTIEDGTPIGIHPGGQGDLHLSLVADPTDANIVYIGGDRQPAFNEAEDTGPRIFPNSIGSTGFWGRLFRGDASQPSGSQWVHLTNANTLGAPGGGTASNSAPHVDSREMRFDADGNLIEVDDGGVYKRTQPRSNQGDWFSLVGDLQVAEIHDVEIDRNNDILFAGAQDDDAIAQNQPGSLDWGLLLYGDGGDVNVDDTTTPRRSVRYTSVNFLRLFNRSVWNTRGGLVSVALIPHTVLGGGAPIQAQFYTPVRLSAGNLLRMVIGARNGVYESFDRGDTVTAIAPGIRVNTVGYESIAYGAPANPDALYVGGNNAPPFPGKKVWVRTLPPPAPLVQSLSYPGTLPIRAIAIDPANGDHAFVVDAASVYETADAGISWSNVTGNLGSFDPSILRSVTFASTPHGNAVVVGANRGAYLATAASGFASWNPVGKGMPTAPILDLRYDPAGDQLTAGLLGRGVWTLKDVGVAVLLATN